MTKTNYKNCYHIKGVTLGVKIWICDHRTQPLLYPMLPPLSVTLFRFMCLRS